MFFKAPRIPVLVLGGPLLMILLTYYMIIGWLLLYIKDMWKIVQNQGIYFDFLYMKKIGYEDEQLEKLCKEDEVSFQKLTSLYGYVT
jgi:hypothetical protein